jgi:hypothetical protein
VPTAHSFETERSPVEVPVEEVHDFDFLLQELREAPPEAAQDRMAQWIERFRLGWTNTPDQWARLTDLLPRPADGEASITQFRKHLLSATREPAASDLFLTHPAVAPKLSSYAFTDYLGTHAAAFVAGCLNLARAAAQSGSPSSTVMGALSEAVANHPLTLIGIGLHDPGIILPTADGCALADALDLPRERLERWTFEKSEQEVRELLSAFEVDRILDVVQALLGQPRLSTDLLASLVRVALGSGDAPEAAATIGAFAFENAELSAALRGRCFAETAPARAEALAAWARYLSLGDAFAFGWECIRPAGADGEAPPLGEAVADRLKRLEQLLRLPKSAADAASNGHASWTWREPALKALAAIGALAARKWPQREDQLVCEDDAIAALGSDPAVLGPVVRGILDQCQPYWDVLDPVVLRLPVDLVSPVLSDYLDHAALGSDSRHHGARLLAKIRGDTSAGPSGEGLPADPATLPEPSRERKPLASQTWLGEGSIERFWHVALEVAQTRFDEVMTKRYDEEKEEHCAALGDVVARALNGSNAALKMWLRSNGAPPPSIRASVRRAPSKPKKAGGSLQADFAFLLKCNVAGRCVTKRITPFKAKKLVRTSHGWSTDFRIQGGERTQLARLLTLSPATHYLFIVPRSLGDSLRVMPAALVRDVLAAQGFAGGVPLATVLQAGIRLPEFVLFHVLGLWAGDDDADLIAKAESEDASQHPHVTVEINVGRG